jgi:hypothetical protein
MPLAVGCQRKEPSVILMPTVEQCQFCRVSDRGAGKQRNPLGPTEHKKECGIVGRVGEAEEAVRKRLKGLC